MCFMIAFNSDCFNTQREHGFGSTITTSTPTLICIELVGVLDDLHLKKRLQFAVVF